MKKIIISLLWTVVATLGYAAETDSVEVIRPVQSAYMLEAGASHLADTYLSPLKFSGWHAGFSYERMQAMKFDPERWVMQMRFGFQADRAQTMRKSSDLWYWGVNFSWGMMRRWQMPYNITVGVGGSALLDAGCVYAARNGNNPASAKASLTVGATGYAAWNGKVGRLPITVRYQPTLPVTGVFFAPDYGELYYEIYLGNHRGLAHAAWWGNYFRLDNLLTADLHFGSTSLRVGYRADILSTRINHITTHIINHGAVLGISGEWISLNPRKVISRHAKVISATY